MSNDNITVNTSENFTVEQENQIASIYIATQTLLEVLLPNATAASEMPLVGAITELVSHQLQTQGHEVFFPTHITEQDGYSYIENNLAVCKVCRCETSNEASDGSMRVSVNDGFSDRFSVCYSCHDGMMSTGEYTSCECCGEHFTPGHLLPNRDNEENGEKVREICPYCGEVWCE